MQLWFDIAMHWMFSSLLVFLFLAFCFQHLTGPCLFFPSSSQKRVQDHKALCSDRFFQVDPRYYELFVQLPVVAQLDLETSAGLSQKDKAAPRTSSPLPLSHSTLRYHLLSTFHTWKQEGIHSMTRNPYLWLPALLWGAGVRKSGFMCLKIGKRYNWSTLLLQTFVNIEILFPPTTTLISSCMANAVPLFVLSYTLTLNKQQ